jgi:hypothetical protein
MLPVKNIDGMGARDALADVSRAHIDVVSSLPFLCPCRPVIMYYPIVLSSLKLEIAPKNVSRIKKTIKKHTYGPRDVIIDVSWGFFWCLIHLLWWLEEEATVK